MNFLPARETLGSVEKANKYLPLPSMVTLSLRYIKKEVTLKGSEKTLRQSPPSTTAAGVSECTTTSVQIIRWWSTSATWHAPPIALTYVQLISYPITSLPTPPTCFLWSGGSSPHLTLRWMPSCHGTLTPSSRCAKSKQWLSGLKVGRHCMWWETIQPIVYPCLAVCGGH